MVKNNIIVSSVGGNHRNDRQKDDFYPTPEDCITGLLNYEKEYIVGKKIWEPACGDGAISKPLIKAGFDVYSSDLVGRGFGTPNVDFLSTTDLNGCSAIITNPPFILAKNFIEHSLGDLKIEYLALLLKSQYFHAKSRIELFDKFPPSVVYALTWRPDFLGKGASTMDCAWFVWDINRSEATSYKLMKRP